MRLMRGIGPFALRFWPFVGQCVGVLRRLLWTLLVGDGFDRGGLPHVCIALFWCFWFPGGGLEPFGRALRSGGLLPLKKNICFSLGEATRQSVKFAGVALSHLREAGDIKVAQCEREVSHFY